MSVNRSFLYVPADQPRRITKAFQAGADAVLVDLEDAVAPAARVAARGVFPGVVSALGEVGCELWVRINHGRDGLADLEAIEPLWPVLDGVVLAKSDSAGWVDEVAAIVPPLVALSPLVESARAIRRLDELTEHPRVAQCHLGELDLVGDVGAHGAGATELIAHARRELVLASAAAGILAPIGGVEPRIRELAALAATSAELAELGFAGRPALHPNQVEPINTAFTPPAEAVAAAAALVAHYDAALAAGHGVVRAADGSMLDEAVVRRARELIDPGADAL
jgi:citrate lyase subunit beta/citryl-CoA lyase